MNEEGWHDAGSSDLQEGQPVARLVEGHMLMLVRFGDTIHATDAVCPHKFAMLTDGKISDGCVTCPNHDATFDLASGHAGDDTSWAGTLPVHECRIDGETVQVRLTA